MEIPKSVAKISEETLRVLGCKEVRDFNGDIVVNLSFGDILDVDKFEAITYLPTTESISDGITPPKRHS